MKKPVVIGIAGKAGAGKDTVASMFNYIHTVGLTKCKYDEWLTRYAVSPNRYKDKTIHFADAVKDCISVTFGINRSDLDDPRFKKDYSITFPYVDIDKFSSHKERYKSYKIYEDSSTSPFTYKDGRVVKIIVPIRKLMQWYANGLIKGGTYKNVWVDAAVPKILNVVNRYNFCTIPDIRFRQEADVVKNPSFYGQVVRVIRPSSSAVEDSHESEKDDIEADYLIYNNATKLALFYRVVEIVQTLNKKKLWD